MYALGPILVSFQQFPIEVVRRIEHVIPCHSKGEGVGVVYVHGHTSRESQSGFG